LTFKKVENLTLQKCILRDSEALLESHAVDNLSLSDCTIELVDHLDFTWGNPWCTDVDQEHNQGTFDDDMMLTDTTIPFKDFKAGRLHGIKDLSFNGSALSLDMAPANYLQKRIYDCDLLTFLVWMVDTSMTLT
jgi:hypothetical protein